MLGLCLIWIMFLEETVETSVKEKLPLLFFLIMNNYRFLGLSFQSVYKNNVQINGESVLKFICFRPEVLIQGFS